MSYKASLIHTIRNKIRLFREYVKRLKPTIYKERMLLFAGTYEQEYDIGQSRGNNEIFEDINAKVQFMLDYFGGIVEKSRRTMTSMKILRDKQDQISNTMAEQELASYNHEKHINAEGKETRDTIRAYRLHRTALAEITLIVSDQRNNQEIQDTNIQSRLILIKSKLNHVQKIMLDLPKLNLTSYELNKISRIIKQSVKKAQKIRTNQDHLKHPDHPERKKDEILYYRPRPHLIKTAPIAYPPKDSSKLDCSNNHEEYQRITTGYYFILQELDKIIDKQLSYNYLLENFRSKNDYLAKIKPKIHKDEDIHNWMLNNNKEKPDPPNKQDAGWVKPVNETYRPIQSPNLPTGTQLSNRHSENLKIQQTQINSNIPFY